jgi:hypothetical protein
MKTDFVVSSHEQHDFQLLLLPETSQTHWGSPRRIGVLDDSLGAVEWLAAGDVDRDGNTDLLVGIGPPFGGMGVFFSPGLPTAPEAHVWISEFLPRDERSLHIADVDRDGKVDMIAVCGKKREIQFLRGKGNREFERPADIAGGAGCTSFALHPTAGSMDLLVVRGEQGTLSVLKNRFRRP